jgi:hypothetical protein
LEELGSCHPSLSVSPGPSDPSRRPGHLARRSLSQCTAFSTDSFGDILGGVTEAALAELVAAWLRDPGRLEPGAGGDTHGCEMIEEAPYMLAAQMAAGLGIWVRPRAAASASGRGAGAFRSSPAVTPEARRP